MVLGLASDVKVKIQSEKDCQQVVSVEWSSDKVKEKIEQAFVSVQSQAKLPGFRPGKSPMELVRQQYKPAAYERAQDTLLREGIEEALKTKKIHPIQYPVVQKMEFDPEKAFHFEFMVEVAPKFKLEAHKGIKLTKKVKTVTDEDVQKGLQNIADVHARLIESKDDTVKATHFAVIDYQGMLDNKAIKGASAQNFLMDMSAPQAIAGLSDGLLGVKLGEEKEIKVGFPADSPAKELAGKEAIFKVKLNAIKEKSVPVLNDDFAKDVGFKSLDEMKTKMRESLVSESEASTRRDLENQLTEALLNANKFAIPASLVEDQIKMLVNRQRTRLSRQGFGEEDQKKALEAMAPEMKVQAEKDVRLAYVLNAAADAEKIEVTPEELAKKIEDIISKSDPRDRDHVEKALNGDYKSRVQNEIRETKIFDWLIQNAKIKES